EVESVLGTGHDVTVTLVQGDASEGLLETAKGADLLVVGKRGIGAITNDLLGSTSGRVADHAQCPVVIVRAYPDASQRAAVKRLRGSADSVLHGRPHRAGDGRRTGNP